MVNYITFVPFDSNIVEHALDGPTQDFEDNVQLKSGLDAGCTIFLTRDNELLDLKFFGDMKILTNMP